MIDNNRLSKIMEPVKLILTYDLEKLSNEDEVRRIQLWNDLKNSESIFEQELCFDLSQDLKADINSQFSFAELRLAAAEPRNSEASGIGNSFNETELALIPAYDKFNILDVLSANDMAERMQRKKEISNLATEYTKEYAALDALLDSPKIRKDIKSFIQERYKERLNKVNEAVQIYIGKYGLMPTVKQIEKSILEIIKQSEKQRKAIAEEDERITGDMSSKMKVLPEMERKAEQLKSDLDKIESSISDGNPAPDLKALESAKEELAKNYATLEKELTSRIEILEQRKRELEASKAELEDNRPDVRQRDHEENQRLLDGELREIAAAKDRLADQTATLKSEKDGLYVQRQQIIERMRQINEIADGKSVRYISSQDARLCGMNVLARFDAKMQSYPLKLYSPLEKKEFIIRSWQDGEHVNISEQSGLDSPWNVQDRYVVSEKKHGIFGEKVNKIIVESITLNHSDEFNKYKFDSRSANLADFINIVNRIIDKAEAGKYLHIIGIASPTGWDAKVQKEIQSITFAHNYVSRYVSFCLIDSVTGEMIFNPADERITKYVEYFTPEFNREKIETVRQYIIGRLAVKDYVVLAEVVNETKEPKATVNKVFYDLQHEGKGKIKYIKEVGLVIQTLK